MGLSTTHECWRGSYSGFHEFRQAVLIASGLPTLPDPDPGALGPRLAIDWSLITPRQLRGHWDRKGPTAAMVGGSLLTDPVLYLLVHADCEGKLRRGYLPALKARLEEIESRYVKCFDDGAGYMAGRLDRFIAGLGAAIEAGEHVEFH